MAKAKTVETPKIRASVPTGKGGTRALKERKPAQESMAIVPFANRKPLLKSAPMGANYVQFMSTKSERRDTVCEQLGVRSSKMPEDFPVLFVNGNPTYLDPFRYMLTAQFFQHFSRFSDQMELLESYLDVDERPGQDFQECNESLIIVITPDDEFFPAVCNFKATKAGAFHALHTAIEEAKADASDEGVYTKFLCQVTIEEYQSKRSRREMMVCNEKNQVIEEADAKTLKALVTCFQDEEWLKQVSDCSRTLKERYNEVEGKSK